MIQILLAVTTILMFAGGALANDLSEHARKAIISRDTSRTDLFRIGWRDSAMVGCKIVQSSDGRRSIVYQNQQYLLTGYDYSGSSGDLIISQQIEQISEPGVEMSMPWLTAVATLVDSLGQAKALWSISEKADRGEEFQGFYHTIREGCCTTPAVDRLRSFRDGTLIMSYVGDLVTYVPTTGIYWNWSDERFIGALDHGDFSGYPWAADTLAHVSISYASRDSCLHVLLVRAKTDSIGIALDGANGQTHISLVGTDSAMIEASRHPSNWFVTTQDHLWLLSKPKSCLKVEFDVGTPVFIIPLWDDDFWLKQTDFGDYEIVRIK
jgi:hypothetical protein